MGIPHSVTKQLAAASANNIAASQSPGAGAIILNGSAASFLSTTSTAIVAAGQTVVPVTSVAGVVAGDTVTDSTSGAIPAGTTVIGVDATNSKVILSKPVGGTGVGNGDTIVFVGVATLDTQRRVIVTSAGNDSGINFTVFGTNDYGNPISDTFAGANIGAAQSNLDFKTVTAVTHTGTVAGAITIGTNGVGSTPWFGVNWHAQPVNIELSAIIASGAANWSWQYTYDDPNNLPSGVAFPQPWNHPTLNNQAGSLDGSINDPVAAVRLIINSGTGQVRGTWMEAGISGQ